MKDERSISVIVDDNVNLFFFTFYVFPCLSSPYERRRGSPFPTRRVSVLQSKPIQPRHTSFFCFRLFHSNNVLVRLRVGRIHGSTDSTWQCQIDRKSTV